MGNGNVSYYTYANSHCDTRCFVNSKEVDFDAESREERNQLYESKVAIKII